MRALNPSRKQRPAQVIGWREIIDLPDFEIAGMRVKVDTGARTSALHALDQETFERDGQQWVSFRIPTPGKPRTAREEAPIVDIRDIKNTSGLAERRIVIVTLIHLGWHHLHVEASLSNRENMEFDMILGRSAIRKRGFLVDPGHSYLAGKPGLSRKAGHRLEAPRVPLPAGEKE
jgi:hypothetical protein